MLGGRPSDDGLDPPPAPLVPAAAAHLSSRASTSRRVMPSSWYICSAATRGGGACEYQPKLKQTKANQHTNTHTHTHTHTHTCNPPHLQHDVDHVLARGLPVVLRAGASGRGGVGRRQELIGRRQELTQNTGPNPDHQTSRRLIPQLTYCNPYPTHSLGLQAHAPAPLPRSVQGRPSLLDAPLFPRPPAPVPVPCPCGRHE